MKQVRFSKAAPYFDAWGRTAPNGQAVLADYMASNWFAFAYGKVLPYPRMGADRLKGRLWSVANRPWCAK